MWLQIHFKKESEEGKEAVFRGNNVRVGCSEKRNLSERKLTRMYKYRVFKKQILWNHAKINKQRTRLS